MKKMGKLAAATTQSRRVKATTMVRPTRTTRGPGGCAGGWTVRGLNNLVDPDAESFRGLKRLRDPDAFAIPKAKVPNTGVDAGPPPAGPVSFITSEALTALTGGPTARGPLLVPSSGLLSNTTRPYTSAHFAGLGIASPPSVPAMRAPVGGLYLGPNAANLATPVTPPRGTYNASPHTPTNQATGKRNKCAPSSESGSAGTPATFLVCGAELPHTPQPERQRQDSRKGPMPRGLGINPEAQGDGMAPQVAAGGPGGPANEYQAPVQVPWHFVVHANPMDGAG